MIDNEKLGTYILEQESFLIKRVLSYAKITNYVKYTSTLEQAWKKSIVGLSLALVKSLNNNKVIPELNPDEDYQKDPLAAFGILEARLHRARGISFTMFLGLMKYYRQSYLDLIAESGWEKQFIEKISLYVNRFFDRVELGFCSEWNKNTYDDLLAELQAANRKITNEKNKYVTVFESISCPVIITDENNRIENMNHAAAELLLGETVPGSIYYASEFLKYVLELNLPWLKEELTRFLKTNEHETEYEKTVEIEGQYKHISVKMKRNLDVSGKFKGTVITFAELTIREQTEEIKMKRAVR